MRDWTGGGDRGGLLTFSHPTATSSRNRKKQGWRCVLTDALFSPYSPTNLFNQREVLVWLAEEAPNLLCRDNAVLTPAHPALILVLLREAVPEDLKSLPYGLLAHCSDQRKTQFISNQTTFQNLPEFPVSRSSTTDARPSSWAYLIHLCRPSSHMNRAESGKTPLILNQKIGFLDLNCCKRRF